MASLRPVSEAMGGDKSPREILQFILHSAYSTTRASTASLMLIEPGSSILRVEAAEGFRDHQIFKTRLPVGKGVTGWVAETGVPLRLGNVTKDDRYIRVQRGLRSELAVPLKIHGRVVGVISVDSTRLNHFTAEDEELLVSLAAHSARVIQTMWLHDETRRQAEELRLLMEAGQVLAGTLDLDQILQVLVELLAKFWRAPLTAVYLCSGGPDTLRMAAAHGGSEAFREQPPIALAGSAFGRLFEKKGKAALIKDLQEGFPPGYAQRLKPHPIASLLVAPLAAKEKPLGVICIFGSAERPFTKGDLRLLDGLANSASLSIENAHVHRHMLEAEEAMRGSEKANLLVEMAAGLAHEIRNPLTSIKILNHSMLQSVPLTEETRSDARMIQKQVERLERIVAGYLDNARSHATEMNFQPQDLNGIIDETLLLLASAADEGTHLSCNLHPGPLAIRGDATQLSQAFYNLALNAIQAVAQPRKKGGLAERSRIEIATGAAKRQGTVYVEIADDGPGLPAVVKEHLFEPFVTTKNQGVGLGLSIVKRIVEAHGGKLTVESPRADLGHGARFRIELPGMP